MKRLMVAAMAAIVLLASTVCMAQDSDYICAMEDKVAELEARIAHLEALIEKAGIMTPAPAAEAPAKGFSDRVSVSGVLEVEGSITDDEQLSGESSTTSDLVLATMELGMAVRVNDKFSGNLVLLWEEDDTEPIAIDEGTITYSEDTYSITAGRFYPLFGTYNSVFITDPMTLELGETQESGLLFETMLTDSIESAVSIANGDIKNADMGDNTNDYGVSLIMRHGYNGGEPADIGVQELEVTSPSLEAVPYGKGSGWDLGVQYYSDIADADADILGGVTPVKTVGGMAVSFDWSNGPWTVNTELVAAARSFDVTDLDSNGDGDGDRPSAWNLEAAYRIRTNQILALKMETSEEFMDMPELRFGLAYLWDLGDDTAFGLEYMYSEYDGNFTSGVDKEHTFTSQLAIGF